MKKIVNLYSEIYGLENLYCSAYRVASCKRENEDIANYLLNMEENIDTLNIALKGKNYKHGNYEIFQISDPKPRMISKATVNDRVVHHAVHDVICPAIDKSFIYDSYSCRIGKGTHRAIKRVQKWSRTYKYAVHLDIVKYFDSIDRGVLKTLLTKWIKDEDVLWLLNEIIDSSAQIDKYKERGLPLGNLTSQFFANIYLNELDQFVKHTLRIKPYIRYMDDILILGNDKKVLLKMAFRIRDFVKENLALDFHENGFQPFPVNRGIAFLGFRIYPFYRKVLPKGINRFRDRLKKLKRDYENGLIPVEKVTQSIQSSVAFLDFGNTEKVKKELLRDFVLC
jgi:hypothetical protein